MREITSSLATKLLSMDMTKANSALVYCNIGGVDTFKVQSISSFTREEDSYAIGFSVILANVNPSDPMDNGYYNWQRNDSTHNKPANSYQNVIKPGVYIDIDAGYGLGYGDYSDTTRIVSGYIDTVKCHIGAESTLELICRSKAKKLTDETIYSYNTSNSTTYWYMTYPVAANFTTFHLTSANTNPYLYEIFVDACMRGGYLEVDIHWDTSNTLRLNDVDKTQFQEIRGKWIDVARKCAELLGMNMYEDAYGDIYLKEQEVLNYSASGTKTLTGDTWAAFTTPYNYRAIPETIVVIGYARTDWEYDYATNSIRRSEDSTIPSGTTVSITYNYCAWSFINGRDIFGITQWTSQDNMYGQLLATNTELKLARNISMGTYGDGTTISSTKVEITDLPTLITNTQLDNWLTNRKARKLKQYFNLDANILPIMQLEVGDTITCLVWGTITGIYSITGYNLSYDASSGFQMNISAIFYVNSGVY